MKVLYPKKKKTVNEGVLIVNMYTSIHEKEREQDTKDGNRRNGPDQ